MILAALTILTAQAAAPATAEMPSEEAIAEEVVEINRTLDKWKGGIYKKDGKLTCRMEQSSGDQAIDLLRCGAMVGCYSPRAEELDEIAESDAPAEERTERMRGVMAEVQPCIDQAHTQGVRRIALVRASL